MSHNFRIHMTINQSVTFFKNACFRLIQVGESRVIPCLHKSPNDPSKKLENMFKLLDYMKNSLTDSTSLVYCDQGMTDATKAR